MVRLNGLGGPVTEALARQVPVLSPQLWAEERWPGLTAQAFLARAPDHRLSWERVGGAAAVPGIWDDDATVLLACILGEPATAATVATLLGYEQIVCAALVTTSASADDMLSVLQSRAAIEQAKGALMAYRGCDAEQAWVTLRRASQEFNVKVRALAVALVEHISGAPAEGASGAAPVIVDERARRAAEQIWTAPANDARQSSAR